MKFAENIKAILKLEYFQLLLILVFIEFLIFFFSVTIIYPLSLHHIIEVTCLFFLGYETVEVPIKVFKWQRKLVKPMITIVCFTIVAVSCVFCSLLLSRVLLPKVDIRLFIEEIFTTVILSISYLTGVIFAYRKIS